MRAWLEHNWWWVFGGMGAAVYLAFLVHRRGGNEPLILRVLYTLAPVLDPNSEERRKLTPLAMVMSVVGLVVILAVTYFVNA